MAAKIQQLIGSGGTPPEPKRDNFQVVREQVAGILLLELEHQRELANEAGADPLGWTLDVFTEATNPWEAFVDPPEPPKPYDPRLYVPIVDIIFNQSTFNKSKSDISKRQYADAILHVDVYGYGISRGTSDGHVPGDRDAASERDRAVMLVRNVLMASSYTTLGLTGLVGERWLSSISMLDLPEGERNANHVRCARMTFAVGFNEFSPQYQGQPFEGATITVKRQETGQVLLVADFDVPP